MYGLKCGPAELHPLVRSPFSCTWNPCKPGLSPATVPVTLTPSGCCSNVRIPRGPSFGEPSSPRAFSSTTAFRPIAFGQIFEETSYLFRASSRQIKSSGVNSIYQNKVFKSRWIRNMTKFFVYKRSSNTFQFAANDSILFFFNQSRDDPRRLAGSRKRTVYAAGFTEAICYSSINPRMRASEELPREHVERKLIMTRIRVSSDTL